MVSSLAYPNLLGTKRLDCCCCCSTVGYGLPHSQVSVAKFGDIAVTKQILLAETW
jgi:hypothetical protein